MPNARTPTYLPLSLACSLLLLTLTGCATSSLPTPPAEPIKIPSPPVQREPAHSQRYLPKAQTYSEQVRDWLQRLDTLTTTEQPK